MKLAQLFEAQSVFATMLLKLVKAGLPIHVNAKGRTFLSGNERKGYEALRSNHQGWVIQHSSATTNAVDAVKRVLDDDTLHISSYKNYAMDPRGSPISSSLFQFETPIDDHYTIKKVDGVWTVVDRQQVTEAELDDAEFMLKMAQRLAKKHGYEGTLSENNALEFEYAGFTVLVFYEPDKNANRPWAVGWYKNGRRVNPNEPIERFETMRMALADIFGYDLVKDDE